MKKSLLESLKCFDLIEQFQLLYVLLRLKLNQNVPSNLVVLFNELNRFTELIERDVQIRNKKNNLVEFSYLLNQKPLKILVRRNTSDIDVFCSIILEGEYKLVTERFLQHQVPAKTIIDAGANIGCTSLYFSFYFPDARIIALEPEGTNAEMIKKNIALNGNKNVIFLQKALWHNNLGLKIENGFRDGKEWSFSVQESDSFEESILTGITINELLKSFDENAVDIFKIDIEGAERFLFNSSDFISTVDQSVKSLIIEIHDEFNIRAVIYERMEKANFKMEKSGCVDLFYKNDFQATVHDTNFGKG